MSSLLGPAGEREKNRLDGILAEGVRTVAHGRAALRRADWLLLRGAEQAAIADALEALRVLESQPAWGLRAALLCVRLLNRTGRRDRAAALLAETEDDAGVADPATRRALAMAQGELLLEDESRQDACDPLERAFGLSAGDPAAAHDGLRAAQALGLLAQLRGDAHAAVRWLTEATDIARVHDDARLLAEVGVPLGMLQFQRQDPSARAVLAEALQTGAAAPTLAPTAWGVLARLDLAAGDPEAARSHALTAARTGAAQGNAGAFADGALLAAEAEVQLGRTQAALDAAQAAATTLRERGEAALAELLERQAAVIRGEQAPL